ncbi:MAG TPA: TolC family protein, partial [Allocoleopsis sp.]
DIQAGIKRVDAQVQNGVSFRSNLNLLKAELLKAEQREIEISSTRTGLLEALAQFLGQELPADVRLITPLASIPADSILRPELKLYDEQSKLLAGQSQWIKARNLPKASVFGQAGYGKPGLNMLKNDFDLYYIAGVRLSWSISGLYTKKNEEEQVSINRKIVETQKETFLLNTNAQLKQEAAEIDKLQKLVETDKAIVDLRRSVTDAAKAQLDNAVITATDYLNQVNAEDQARQTMILHELQLLQARITYERTKGH